MDFSTVLWIVFLVFIFSLPAAKRRFLDYSRQAVMRKLQKKRKSRCILLVHRQETMSFFGIPVIRFIDINDSEEVMRAIRLTDPEVPIDLILHTPGGLVLASLQIAHAIRRHTGKVTVFVPHYAMSGGSMIALAADKIVMDPNAVLGPVDPQVGTYPAVSLLSVLEEKNKDRIDDETLVYADVGRKAIRQVKEEVFELLLSKMEQEKAEELADLLSRGHWTHDHPITFEDAKKLGLPVSSEMPKEIYELMELFPQPVRMQPAVQYIPEPHHAPPRRPKQS